MLKLARADVRHVFFHASCASLTPQRDLEELPSPISMVNFKHAAHAMIAITNVSLFLSCPTSCTQYTESRSKQFDQLHAKHRAQLASAVPWLLLAALCRCTQVAPEQLFRKSVLAVF